MVLASAFITLLLPHRSHFLSLEEAGSDQEEAFFGANDWQMVACYLANISWKCFITLF